MSISSKSFTTSLLALTIAASILGCPLKKKKVDTTEDEEPVADAATVSVSGTGAKNEKDVSRYQKEVAIANEPAVVSKEGVKAKSFPGGGNDVASLPKGTAVTKIAKYFSTAVLVTFDDPSGDGTKLLGWVLPDQIAAPSAGTTATTTPVRPVVKPVTPTDAGAVAAKDAGAATAAVDAGAAPTAAADAGSGGAATVPPGTLFVPLADGKCPQGFAPLGAGCRRPCNTDKDCPTKTFCVANATSGGKKACQSSK